MSNVRDFLSLLLPYVPGAPDVACMNAIRRAAYEFCLRSMVWRANHVADLVAGTTDYAVPADTDASVFKVLSVAVSGVWLEPIQIDELARKDNWSTLTAALPSRYYIIKPGRINVWPNPTSSVTGGLKFQTAQQPTMDCTTIPDYLYSIYGQAMIDGALAFLMSTPGKEFTQVELAAWHRAQFENQIANAASQAAEAFGRTPLRTAANV